MESMQQQLIELKASQILREITVQQNIGSFTDGKGKYCAQGAIMKYLGWDGTGLLNKGCNFKYNPCLMDYWEKMRSMLGDMDTRLEVASLNDRGATFQEIADWLENKGL
jgi:hypothetical protein